MTSEIEDDGSLGDVDQAVVYRVAQEALRNVVKHSEARNVKIRIVVADGGCDLSIADDGIGLDPGETDEPREQGHLGLTVLARPGARRGRLARHPSWRRRSGEPSSPCASAAT